MRMTTRVSAAVVAIALTLAIGTMSASGQSATRDGVTPSPKAADESAPASHQFRTLAGITAVPMATGELEAVKGMDIHFTTPSQNAGHPHVQPFEGWHFVNHQGNNFGNGQALPGSGPGYSGLCGAALLSPALTIPGQTSAGTGGGC